MVEQDDDLYIVIDEKNIKHVNSFVYLWRIMYKDARSYVERNVEYNANGKLVHARVVHSRVHALTARQSGNPAEDITVGNIYVQITQG